MSVNQEEPPSSGARSPLSYWRENFGSDAVRLSQSNLESIRAAKERSVAAKKRLGAATKEFRQSNSVDLAAFRCVF